MQMKRMIEFDLKNFIRKHRKRFLLPICFSFFVGVIFLKTVDVAQSAQAQAMGNWKNISQIPGFMDFWYYVFSGLAQIRSNEKFEVPAAWMVANLFALFMVSGYLSFSMKGMGRQVMIKNNSQFRWCVSKSAIYILAAGAYYVLFFMPQVLIFSRYGTLLQPLTRQITDSLALPFVLENNKAEMLVFLVLPICSTLIQMFFMGILELYFGATLAFLSMVAGAILSAYFSHPILNTVFVMLRRTEFSLEGGICWYFVPILLLISLFLFLGLGWQRCKRMDVGMEGEKCS